MLSTCAGTLTTIPLMSIAAKLKKLCEARGFTNQRKLAADLDVSKSTLGRWLSGESIPDIEEAWRLSRLLGVSLDFLANDEVEEPAPGLSDEQRQVLWAAEQVGYGLAVKRIMQAPESKAAPGQSWLDREAGRGPEGPR